MADRTPTRNLQQHPQNPQKPQPATVDTMTQPQNPPETANPTTNNGPEPEAGTRGHIVTHGACGTRWRQSGNRTGHCSGCHLQFDGLTAFDTHQSVIGGVAICTQPTEPKWRARTDGLATYWSLTPSANQQAFIDRKRAERTQ